MYKKNGFNKYIRMCRCVNNNAIYCVNGVFIILLYFGRGKSLIFYELAAVHEASAASS